MNHQQAEALKYAIKKLVEAEITYSWKDYGPPGEVKQLKSNLLSAQIGLAAIIAKLTEKEE